MKPTLGLTFLGFTMAAAACGGSNTRPGDPGQALTQTTNTTHYLVHFAPGDSVDTAWQDRYYEWLLRRTGDAALSHDLAD